MPDRVERRLLHQLLMRLEQQADRRGWDEPPRLMLITGRGERDTAQALARLLPAAPTCSAGPYTARQLLPEVMFGFASAAVVVRRLALRMIDPPPVGEVSRAWLDAMLELLRRPGFLGLVLLSEGYGMQRITDEHLERYQAGQAPKLIDTPGAQEVRLVNAVMVDGGTHDLFRFRGQRPMPIQVGATVGAVGESLAAIIAVVQHRQPEPMMYEPVSRRQS